MKTLLFPQGFIILIFIILVLIISYIIISYRKKSYIYGGVSIPKTPGDQLTMSTSETLRASGLAMTTSPMSMAMTYTISGEDNGLDFSQLRSLLKDAKKYGVDFIEKPTSETVNVSFGTFKNDTVINKEVKRWNYDPAFMKQKSAIKNTLGSHHQIINKSELYNTIKKLIPNGIKFLPKSFTPEEMDTILKTSNIISMTPYIIKKDNVPQQQAVRVITSKDEYYKAKKELNINKH